MREGASIRQSTDRIEFTEYPKRLVRADERRDNGRKRRAAKRQMHRREAVSSRDFERDMRRRKSKCDLGITLTEMMVVVAILAVVVALAAPNLAELFIRNRLETASNEFVTALNFARSEAMRRGVPVSIRRVSATAREWTEGWQVFVDINGNGIPDAGDPREEVLRVGQPLVQPLTLRSSRIVETFVPFAADGRVGLNLDDGVDPLKARGIFVLCHAGVLQEGGRSRSRAVLLNTAGRTRLGVDSNGNGIPEDAFGLDVRSCNTPS